MRRDGAACERDQLGAATADRLHLERAQAVAEVAVRPPARRPALGAVHAADPMSAHRRLLAGPVIVLAPRLATRRQLEVEAPWCGRTATVVSGHGVSAWIRRNATRGMPAQCGQVQSRRPGPNGARSELQSGGHEPKCNLLGSSLQDQRGNNSDHHSSGRRRVK
jgi:hypothetical protein